MSRETLLASRIICVAENCDSRLFVLVPNNVSGVKAHCFICETEIETGGNPTR